LQLLACLRGGSDEDKVRDDELFAPGEIENLFRDENEVRILRETLGWDKEDLVDESYKVEQSPNRKGKQKDAKTSEDIADFEHGIVTGSAFQPPKTRLNLEALSQFMFKDHGRLDDTQQFMGLEAITEVDPDNMEQISGQEVRQDDEQMANPLPKRRRLSTSPLATNFVTQPAAEDAGEVVFEWRPPSPGSGVTYSDSRYEEEYD